MAGKTPREAVDKFLTPLQRARSCVTESVLVVSHGGHDIVGNLHSVTFGDGSAARLRGSHQLWLEIKLHYRIVEAPPPFGPYKVSTSGYIYSLKDANHHDVVSYHWHPVEQRGITTPHLHLGAGAQVGFPNLQGAHLPTGRIALEEVLRLGITELGIQTLRLDWEQILDSTQRAYEEWRTWAGSGPVI